MNVLNAFIRLKMQLFDLAFAVSVVGSFDMSLLLFLVFCFVLCHKDMSTSAFIVNVRIAKYVSANNVALKNTHTCMHARNRFANTQNSVTRTCFLSNGTGQTVFSFN